MEMEAAITSPDHHAASEAMIVRSIVSRQGSKAALLAPIAQPCQRRTITYNTLAGEITPEKLEELTAAAALRRAELGRKGPKKDKPWVADITPAYRTFRRLKAATKEIGSNVERGPKPSDLIDNPLRPDDITLEVLMASQTHMGHHTSLWNPSNARYIYGVRQEIHIISLETTAAHLRRAARVVEEVVYRGGLVLFVGTRPGQMDIVTKAAHLSGGCHLFTKWTPGNITNRDQINKGKQVKVVDALDRTLRGFEKYGRNTRPLAPDLVVCLNPQENYTMLYECGLANIPTIGVIDTDANPDWVTYTIPANDDSFRSIALIGGVLGRAGQWGRARRLEDARNGVVTWTTPIQTERFMNLETSRWALELERWQRNNSGKLPKNGREGGGESLLLEMVEAQRERILEGEESAENIAGGVGNAGQKGGDAQFLWMNR